MHSRLARLRSQMREHGLDAFVVSSIPNIRYLTGFTGSNGLCVVTRYHAAFLTDPRYAQQSKDEVRGVQRHVVHGGLFDAAVNLGILKRSGTVGFESDELPHEQYRRLRRLLKGARLSPTLRLVEELSLVKDSVELACIRRAVRITEHVYRDILRLLKPGVTEKDIAAEISYRHRRYGADRDAFEPIVASGPRSAFPHATPTARKIRNRETVILDFGCRVNGYGSDLTRTVAVGAVRPKSAEMYAVVRTAQRLAIAAVRAGMKASDLDAVARDSIRKAGYGKYFSHSLGHGLGLRVHELPRISALSKEVLQKGSVITIEPGVYVPGYGGVRIEDDVVVGKDGCSVLTTSPQKLMVV